MKIFKFMLSSGKLMYGWEIKYSRKQLLKKDNEYQTLSDGGDACEDNQESRHKPRQQRIYISCLFHARRP